MARRHGGNETGFLWAEPGQERTGLVAEVAPIAPVYKTYDFAVPATMEADLAVGRRVTVGMGRSGRQTKAFIVGLSRRAWEVTLRPIEAVLDADSFLTDDLIELGRRIATHYACPLGIALKALAPESVRRGAGLKRVRYARALLTIAQVEASSQKLTPKRRAVLKALCSTGDHGAVGSNAEGSVEAEPSRPGAREKPAARGEAIHTTAIRVRDLCERVGVGKAVLRGMVRAGMVEIQSRVETPTDATTAPPRHEPAIELTPDQCEALDVIRSRINTGGFSATLVYGVSGSGKTEVYIRAIRHVLAQGRQAILLVPEIMLTTQLVLRLAERFDNVAVSHSGLTAAQRSGVWREVASGRGRVVIGTRSAVFAPCPDLGLICIDEEQERSYKNLASPRFHVRDVALMRAHRLGIPVVLGSATPSLETWYRSERSAAYARVTLPRRVHDRPMPDVSIVDMALEADAQQREVVLSRLLERRLDEMLTRGQQAILLLNRRGFATRLLCAACRQPLVCPRCNLHLVAHIAGETAVCHYCLHRMPIPPRCPIVTCDGQIVRRGVGTQRVEAELTRRFTQARIQRVDSDTMRHRSDYERVVRAFSDHEIDILIGTQMIAKGLDFPGVSLVGVFAAEALTGSPDFRNQESLFQLLTQVAGRAGRADVPGQVIVQTLAPQVPALAFTRQHDFEGFAAREMALRRRLDYPPFTRLTRLVVMHEREETVENLATTLATAVRTVIEELGLAGADALGPAPCSRPRLRGHYRYDLLARTQTTEDRERLLQALRDRGALRPMGKGIIVDVDPVSMD